MMVVAVRQSAVLASGAWTHPAAAAFFPHPALLSCSSPLPLQFLYLEHNALRCLPPGPYWRHLNVLSTDWEPLLRSHQLLHEVGGWMGGWLVCAAAPHCSAACPGLAVPVHCPFAALPSCSTCFRQLGPNDLHVLACCRRPGYASWLWAACPSSECLPLLCWLLLLACQAATYCWLLPLALQCMADRTYCP
jgi:hypothetical protein